MLPTTRAEAVALGWDELDVVLVSGDAYVDHPSFAAAIVGRFLQSLGLRVGVIPQPDWRRAADFAALGRPRLFFGVTAGNIDSMVAHYTAQRKIRTQDAYTEHGAHGARPYLPTVVYTNRLKAAFKDAPVIVGGIEASLRRVAHYDCYTDRVRAPILLDAKADLLVFGNGEAPLKEIVLRMGRGEPLGEIRDVRGTAVPLGKGDPDPAAGAVELPAFEAVRDDKAAFALMTRLVLENLNPYNARPLLQRAGTRRVWVNPPALPLAQAELDRVYALPFERRPHPRYKGKVPAFEMIAASITAHRGCYGGCSFCALSLHQGRFIQSRSKASIVAEAAALAGAGRAVVTDVGGPTANMYGTGCTSDAAMRACARQSCLFPRPCPHLGTDAGAYVDVLRAARAAPGVRGVFVNSGVRYDLARESPAFIEELARHHVQGELSVAPEHCDEGMLALMHKPPIAAFEAFLAAFRDACRRAGRPAAVAPYLIVGHPGATDATEGAIRAFVVKHGLCAEQIQEFYPTPMSLSTAMHVTGMDTYTGRPLAAGRKLGEKRRWKERILGRPASSPPARRPPRPGAPRGRR